VGSCDSKKFLQYKRSLNPGRFFLDDTSDQRYDKKVGFTLALFLILLMVVVAFKEPNYL
jgi:hypothetical protein